MAIFILTNRKVESAGGRERIQVDGSAPVQTNLRIARMREGLKDYDLLPDLGGNAAVVRAAEELARGTAVSGGGSAQMLGELYRAMTADAAKQDVLFFIHGFQYDFADNLEHIRQLHRLYLAPKTSPLGHIVYFSWPGNGAMTQYRDDQLDARESGRQLARMFDRVRLFFAAAFGRNGLRLCGNRIHLAAHSMGNQVLEEFFACMPEDPGVQLFTEALLLNADADATAFEPGGKLAKVHHYAHRTSIYIHRGDSALDISSLTKNSRRRLGKRGPSNPDRLPSETFVIDTSAVPADKGTTVKERFVDHWGYLFRQGVIADIHATLRGEDEDDIARRRKQPDLPAWFTIQPR